MKDHSLRPINIIKGPFWYTKGPFLYTSGLVFAFITSLDYLKGPFITQYFTIYLSYCKIFLHRLKRLDFFCFILYVISVFSRSAWMQWFPCPAYPMQKKNMEQPPRWGGLHIVQDCSAYLRFLSHRFSANNESKSLCSWQQFPMTSGLNSAILYLDGRCSIWLSGCLCLLWIFWFPWPW